MAVSSISELQECSPAPALSISDRLGLTTQNGISMDWLDEIGRAGVVICQNHPKQKERKGTWWPVFCKFAVEQVLSQVSQKHTEDFSL